MSVVIVENAESDGRKDAGEIEEERRRQHFLWRLDADQAVLVIGDVVRQPAGQILADTLAETAQLVPLLLDRN